MTNKRITSEAGIDIPYFNWFTVYFYLNKLSAEEVLI